MTVEQLWPTSLPLLSVNVGEDTLIIEQFSDQCAFVGWEVELSQTAQRNDSILNQDFMVEHCKIEPLCRVSLRPH
jgi:hypothetical protein